jgi:hypothetical protein
MTLDHQLLIWLLTGHSWKWLTLTTDGFTKDQSPLQPAPHSFTGMFFLLFTQFLKNILIYSKHNLILLTLGFQAMETGEKFKKLMNMVSFMLKP